MMVKAERATINVDAARKFRRLALSLQKLPDWTLQDGVRVRGKHVREALYTHPGLVPILEHLAQTPNGQVKPLFMKLAAGDAEMIPWEAMCWLAGDFMALDQRWPIGRVSEPLAGAGFPAAVFKLPVRMLVVISAYGIAGQKQEWAALEKAVVEARNSGLALELKVLVGEAATHAAVQSSIAAGLADVELAGLDSGPARLVQEIVGWQPNIVHFFCHGHAGSMPSDQCLELATAADFLGQVGQGSVRLHGRHLTDMLSALTNPWLLNLNCCSGGAGAADCVSLANQMAGAGFPAVVAMLEPVDAGDAHEFTRGFYRSLFRTLLRASTDLAAKAAAAPGARVDFEFAQVMYEARNAICDRYGGDAPNRREWVLPVLYVRGVEPLQFVQPPAMPDQQVNEYKQRARIVAAWLQQVRETLDAEGRREVMQSSLGDVPPEFWPDVEGNFTRG